MDETGDGQRQPGLSVGPANGSVPNVAGAVFFAPERSAGFSALTRAMLSAFPSYEEGRQHGEAAY